MAITKNVCTYNATVYVKGIADPFTFADATNKPYGTLAYQTFMGGGDVVSKLAGESADSEITIPRNAVAAFVWTKSCSEATVENDICQ